MQAEFPPKLIFFFFHNVMNFDFYKTIYLLGENFFNQNY